MDNNKWACYYFFFFPFARAPQWRRRSVKVYPHNATIGLEGDDVTEAALEPHLCGDVSVSVLMRLWLLLLLLLLLGTFSSAQLGAFRRRKLQFLSLSPATNVWDFAFMTLMKRLNYRPMRTTSYKWGKFNFSLFGWWLKAGLFGLWTVTDFSRELFLLLL